MSRVRHDGENLEAYLAPISQRFPIPTFFVVRSLGIPMIFLLSQLIFLALVAAALLLAFRDLRHRRRLPTGGDGRAHLPMRPNPTIAVLAGNAMLQTGVEPGHAAWAILTGLFTTMIAILPLPSRPRNPSAEEAPSAMPH
ncbi:MAG: hypothetical protein Q8J74_01000 [Candidatus Didemnitutus sp.]|nr:hypothetical protein [Candidatus Didemnitutus sp.]